ncbi:sensor histidine kinase [Anaerovorax odorimutans]|uniref:sensor histidine kinase n=1 Tax=Anaerovorax odorimutans TaxID=109327 RepID=UPI0004130F93|nr:HAMP domain-containing sensor histidine kinase [Anaerovorax odorimutans]
MEIKQPKATSLYALFLRHLAAFCAIMVLIVIVLISSFYYALAKGIILPANYAEQALQKVENQLIESESFDQSLIPLSCTYVLFGRSGDVQSSNMSENEISRAKEYLSGNSNGQFRLIQRSDGSSLVVKYDILAHFASPVLHKLFPEPEIMAIIISFACFIFIAVIIAFRFSKKLKTELAPIIKATDSIKQKDLYFNIVPTQIRELNTVLQSIDELKTALSDSLNQQWDIEQSKKTQISAIAHDIKTPLTIIKGNTELLLESELPQTDKDLLQYIQISSGRIENYIQLLMDTATVTDSAVFLKHPFPVQGFLLEIEEQAKALCNVKNIALCIEKSILPETFCGDESFISRAVLNILDNAVEYSSNGSAIKFKITGNKETLSFIVADSGKGFSAAGFKNATMEFFTERAERSGKHYGLGLYIAKSVAESHGGQLEIANRQDGHGAVVTLTIKNSYCD